MAGYGLSTYTPDRQEYNSILADQGYTLIDRNRPYDQETQSISFAANLEPDLKSARRERAIIFIILLLVPALVFTFTKANVLKWSVSNTIPLTSTDEALAL